MLASLGGDGAILVDAEGALWGQAPVDKVVSTVGAGDSSLAGYLRADVSGLDAPERLRMAVAYGSAAASLPGSALPSPAQTDTDAVAIRPVSHQPAN